MANIILHKDGAYNLYSTIADGPIYTKALTLSQLYEAVRVSGGQDAVDKLPERLKRAHATGCSSIHGETLEQCISCNRVGPGESQMSLDAFIEEFLTLRT